MESSCESNAYLDPNFALRLFSKFGQVREIVPKIKLIINEFRRSSEVNQSKCLSLKNNSKSNELREQADRIFVNKDDSLFVQALALYNESICYAENGYGENLAVGYANRANVYFELKEYEICLENISLAENNSYPESLKLELNKLKNGCFELLQKHSTEQKKEENKTDLKLNLEQHQRMPFIASCLELKTDSVRGRHIVTTKDINPGEILIIETPFEKVLNNDCVYQRCTNCLKRNMLNLIPCPNCTKAMFCSDKCMHNAFKRFHQFECPIIDCLYDVGGQITLRTFLNAIQSFDSIHELIEFMKSKDQHNLNAFSFDHSKELSAQHHYYQIHCLSTNSDIRPQLDLFTHAMVVGLFYYQLSNYTSFKDFINEENDESLIELMFRIELITTINSFNFNDLSSVQHSNIIGTGVYPVSSLINHSCSPNTCPKYYNTKLHLYTMQPIKKGESISISYK